MAVQVIKISDWKNYAVKTGDLLEVDFNVLQPIPAILSGSKTYIADPLISWIEPFAGVGAGGVSGASAWTKAFLNKVLSIVTPVGPLSAKIQINWQYTYLFDSNTKLRVTFKVIQNSWPLLYFAGAVGAILFGYLTIREVRLYKQAAEGIQPASTGGILDDVYDITKTAAGTAVMLLVAGLIYILIIKK